MTARFVPRNMVEFVFSSGISLRQLGELRYIDQSYDIGFTWLDHKSRHSYHLLRMLGSKNLVLELSAPTRAVLKQ